MMDVEGVGRCPNRPAAKAGRTDSRFTCRGTLARPHHRRRQLQTGSWQLTQQEQGEAGTGTDRIAGPRETDV